MKAESRFNARTAPEVDNLYVEVNAVKDSPSDHRIMMLFRESSFGRQLLVRMTRDEAIELVDGLSEAIAKTESTSSGTAAPHGNPKSDTMTGCPTSSHSRTGK
jgi:hypothetical protein